MERISLQLSDEIDKIRKKRIERKENFLNLLEEIVLKCKNSHEN